MIRLEHAGKVYRKRRAEVRALDDVSLEIAPGAFVAVRGPSGSGKSTLLALLGGLAAATSGEVIVAGSSLGALSPRQRARFRAENIGFVFQMFHLLPYLNVLDNALVGSAEAGAAGEKRARELLERFQLGHRLDHHPGELSAGERQRVAIARALINKPRLLLADEPTGNLDPDTAAGVLDLLDDFHRQGGTIVLVTHESAAAARAERVVRLRAGRLVDESPAETTASDTANR